MDILSEKRRTEVIITNAKHQKLVGLKYIFDIDGQLLTETGDITPKWLINKLRDHVLIKPHVSGKEQIELFSPKDGKSYAQALMSRYLDVTVGELLEERAGRIPDQEAVVDITANARMTYRQLNDASNHLAKKLIDLGVGKNDIVAVVMLNCLELLIAKYAVNKIGAIIANISPFEKTKGLKNLLQRIDATVLLLREGTKSSETINALYEICPELHTAAPGKLQSATLPKLHTVIVARSEKTFPGTFQFTDLMRTPPDCTDLCLANRMRTFSHSDIATIIHTSGTSSFPKSVMLTHGTIIENALWHKILLDICEEDRIFTPVPLFHALGCIGSVLSALIAGATLVCLSKPAIDLSLEVLCKEKCTVIFAVPSYYVALIEAVKERCPSSCEFFIRLCVMAGAECTRRTILDLFSIMQVKDVLSMYGMTEAGPGISSTTSDDPIDVKTKTVGKPWPGISIKLINAYEACDGYDHGEICVRGYNVMSGYYKDEEATSAAIDDEGWLHTGDIGYITIEGNLAVCGRTKDIITKNGENISPKEVESLLIEHPQVQEAFVVGANDYKCGEDIYAFVKKNNGSQLNEEDLKDFCRGKIATLKIPTHISFVEEFATSSTGKILRRELRAIAQTIHNTEKGCGL